MLSKGLRTAALAAAATLCLSALCLPNGALAQKRYDTGASDTEIKIGNIIPYSGPASSRSPTPPTPRTRPQRALEN